MNAPDDMITEVTRHKDGFTVRGYKGGKSGGGSGSGGITEQADNLHSISYARLLCLLGEGEWEGVDDPTTILQYVYLNGTPLQNSDSSFNFDDVTVTFRSGTQEQDYIPDNATVESPTSVEAPLTYDTPWSQALFNTELNAVRITLGVQALTQTSESGNISGYKVDYAIDLQTDGGAFTTVLTNSFNGKTTQPYLRTHRIDLPPATTGWLIRVRRITPDTTSSLIADSTFVSSYAEVIDAKLRYPMSALLHIKVDAKQFSSIPTVAVNFKMLISKVPTNYDPITRSYTGTWDGTFKMAWHDNPAWAFYAIVENNRFGLGDRVSSTALAQLKWTLYPIAQYCDELVPDGFGGQEPRFTCNVYLQTQAEAWKVLNDFASIFRGMCYEMAGSILVSADMPAEPVYTFTNANAINGKFTKVGTARKTRNSIALVSYNNPNNMDKQAVEPVVEKTALARYGLRQKSLTAFGCRSRGQAVRFGRWDLLNSWTNTQAITFGVGLDKACVSPGKIVRIADQHFAGKRIGGRIRSVSPDGLTFVLDSDAPIFGTLPITADSTSGTADDSHYTADYFGVAPTLVVNLPSGVSESRTFTYTTSGDLLTTDDDSGTADTEAHSADYNGTLTVISVTVDSAFSEIPEPECVWAIEQTTLTTQLVRVISVLRETAQTATIAAVQYTPDLLTTVDYNTVLDILPVSVVSSVQAMPASITITSYIVIDQNTSTTNLTISWASAPGAQSYDIQWRLGDSNWVSINPTASNSADVLNVFGGTYTARVRARNVRGIPSPWKISDSIVVSGILPAPDAPTFLGTLPKVFAIRVYWTLPTDPNIIAQTRILYNSIDDLGTAETLIDVAYPTNAFDYGGLNAGQQVYFWIQFIDRNGSLGDIYPPVNGILGTSSTSASEILGYLGGQITSTELASSLLTRIETGEAGAAQAEATVDDLAAMYTIKTQLTSGGHTYVAGIGVGVENTGGIIESQVLVRADKFAIINTTDDTNISVPFAVSGGQTFINDAYIQNGSITTAKIQDAAITSAKIGDAQITTAKIGDAQVDTLKLAGQAVTIPTYAFTAAATGAIGGSWTTIQTLTTTLPESSPVLVLVSFFNNGGAGSIRIQRNGSDIFAPSDTSAIPGNEQRAWSWSMVDYPSAGTATYTVQVMGGVQTPNVQMRTLTVITLRR